MSIIPSIGFIPFGSALPLRRLFKSPANKCSIDSGFEWTHRVRTPKTPTPTTKSSDSLICPCCRSTTMASAAGREDAPGFTEIAVIRHGETSCNASRIIQGHLDSDLNEIGRHQAIAVADRLSKEPKFAAIYSSDLKRAAETANIIADICALPEVILDSALRERHLGDLQGLNLHDAKKLKPEAYKKFLSSKREGEIPGGGESLDQLNERCVSCLEKIVEKHKGERVIVVTHGGVLRELRKHSVSSQTKDRKIRNTSVNVFLISESGNWTIKTWGDISHLRETGFLSSAFRGDGTSG